MRLDLFKKHRKKVSSDSGFKSVVEDICKDGGKGSYHLSRKADDGTGKYLAAGNGEVKDLKDTDPEHWIRTAFGGGDYSLKLSKADDKGFEILVKTFTYNIYGEPKELRYESARKKETETSAMLEIFKTSFDYAEKIKSGNTDMPMMVAIMQESTKQTSMMFAQMIEMQNKSHESMLRLMRDQKESTNPVTEALENIMQLKEVEGMMSPKIERDNTLEWVKALSNNPILAGIVSKVMNLELPQGQQIPMIPAQLPGIIEGDGHKPRIHGSPSASLINGKINPSSEIDQKANPSLVPPDSPNLAELRNGRTDLVPPSNGRTDNLYDNKPNDFETNMIDPLLDAISAGIDAPNIAIIINQVIQWSVTLARMDKEVHPLMKGFVDFMLLLGESDIDFALLDKIYMEFCSGIEMPAELISPVKEELLKNYMPIFQQIMVARNKEKAKDIIDIGKEVRNESESTTV